tara:strand:+ start:7900 stop:10995 length:3096 start_codon:yes stop_codon:yes gene_type:complete
MKKIEMDIKLIPQNKNVGSLYMEPKLKSFKLDINEKNPSTSMEWGKKGKHNGYWQDTGDYKSKWKCRKLERMEDCSKNNWAYPTGKDNMISVLDCDFYSKGDKVFDAKDSKFIQAFPDYLDIETFMCQTGNGGQHLFFQYEPRLKQTQCDEHFMDTRSDGGLVIAPGSMVNGKKYKVLKNKPIAKMSDEMLMWCLDNLYAKKVGKGKVNKSKKIIVINPETNEEEEHLEQEIDLSVYKVGMSDYMLHNIIKKLPKKYFNSYGGYFIFTTAMKSIGRKDIWKQYPKLNNPVDKDVKSQGHINWMNNMWNTITEHTHILAFNNLLINSKYNNARTTLDYYKYKPDIQNVVVPDEIIDSGKNKGSEKGKLGHQFFNKYTHKKCLMIKSDTGTGKTTSFKSYVEDGKPFISIVSRVSLGLEQEKVFKEAGIKCHFHQDITDKIKKEGWGYGNTWSDYEGQNIIINIDSINKMNNWQDFSGYNIYLDEVNSMVEYLVNVDLPTIQARRRDIFELLEKMFEQCDKVIGTDADINDITLEFMKMRQLDPYYIKNEYKHNANIPASEIGSYTQFVKELNSERKWICCCDSKTMAEVLGSVSGSVGTTPDCDILLITSDTKGHFDLDKWDKVIYSPKIIYGIDSTMPRKVYTYYCEQTITPKAMLQQVCRCRNIVELKYLFTSKSCKPYNYHSYEDVLNEIKENDLYGANVFKLNNDQQYQDYIELLAKYKYNFDCYDTNKFAHFLVLLKDRGFKNHCKIFQTSIKGEKKAKDEFNEEKKGLYLNAVNKYKPYIEDLRMNNQMEINQRYVQMRKDEGVDEDDLLWINSQYEKEIDKNNRDLGEITQFFSSSTIEINTLLQIPYEIIDQDLNMCLITDQNRLSEHWHISKFFTKNEEQIFNKLEQSMDFNCKKTTSIDMKMILLNKIRGLVCNKPDDDMGEYIVVDKGLTPELAQSIQTEYKKVFSHRKKSDIDYTDKYKVKQLIVEMYKHLFGKGIIRSKKVRDGDDTHTDYVINKPYLEKHLEIVGYRRTSDKDDNYNQ